MGKVVDPAGVTWRVTRRWYPWRRNLSLRDFLTPAPATETEQPTDAVTDAPTDAAIVGEQPDLPKNVVLKVLFLVVGVLVWIVVGVAKVIFYTGVVVLFLVASIIELVLALLIMPISMVLRIAGLSRWPIEIGRGGKHFATDHAGDYGAAGALRDRLSEDIAAGRPPPAAHDAAA